MEYISFPGLGIEPFHIDKVAFSIFGRNVAWYGILICLGIILAVCYALYRAKKENIKSDHIIDLAFFLVLFGIIGARLYYVIFEFDNYLVTGRGFTGNLIGTLKNVCAIWNGGIAIYGAVIAGFFTALVVCRVKKLSLLKIADIAAPAVMIGQIIGRWGNFVNVEAYGSATNLPWRMGIHLKFSETWMSEKYVHPTFLYESLWNLIGFGIAQLICRKKKFDGQILYFYMAWYGFGRMLIEGLRTDSLMIGSTLRVSQLVGLVTFIAGVALTVIFLKREKKRFVKSLDAAVAPAKCECEGECVCDKADGTEKNEESAENAENSGEDSDDKDN